MHAHHRVRSVFEHLVPAGEGVIHFYVYEFAEVQHGVEGLAQGLQIAAVDCDE
jgi:hypothetical protein